MISDIQFARNGVPAPDAGVEFARVVRALQPDVPVMLQSSDLANEVRARDVGAAFLQKGSPMHFSKWLKARTEFALAHRLRPRRSSTFRRSFFFQNLAAASIGYFTVNPQVGDGYVDWDWLAAQPAEGDTGFVRHLRLSRPVRVVMSGKRNVGVILKPAS